MCDHFGDRQHLHITARMIVVLVRIDDVLQRLVGDRLHLRKDIRVVAVEHVIDEDHAVVRRIQRDVAAFTRNHVQVALHTFGA